MDHVNGWTSALLPSNFRPDLGDVQGWLGAVSIILAFVIFGLDRRNRSRAQIDALGVWTAVSYAHKPPFSEEPVEDVSTTVFARNAADVPIKVVQIACALSTVWLVVDQHQHITGMPGPWEPKPGLDPPVRFFIGPVTVAPGEQFQQSAEYNVDHLRPEGGVQLDLSGGASCDVMWVLAIDNAGRRWEMRPGTSGRARRMWRWSRRREYQPVDWGWFRA